MIETGMMFVGMAGAILAARGIYYFRRSYDE